MRIGLVALALLIAPFLAGCGSDVAIGPDRAFRSAEERAGITPVASSSEPAGTPILTLTPAKGSIVALPASRKSCPDGYPVKGYSSHDGSHYFYAPGQAPYTNTLPEICFATASAAESKGYDASPR